MKKIFNTLMLALFVGLLFSCQNPINTSNEVTPGWYLLKGYESLTSEESRMPIEVESQTVQAQRRVICEKPKHFYLYINSSGEVERAGDLGGEYTGDEFELYKGLTYSYIMGQITPESDGGNYFHASFALAPALKPTWTNSSEKTESVTPGWYLVTRFSKYIYYKIENNELGEIIKEDESTYACYFYINSLGEIERAGEESEYPVEIIKYYKENNYTYSQILEMSSSKEDEQGNKRLTGFIFADTHPSWAN